MNRPFSLSPYKFIAPPPKQKPPETNSTNYKHPTFSANISRKHIQDDHNDGHIQFSKKNKPKLKFTHHRTQSNKIHHFEEELSTFSNSLLQFDEN
jgi:hypothetical protein